MTSEEIVREILIYFVPTIVLAATLIAFNLIDLCKNLKTSNKKKRRIDWWGEDEKENG